MAATNGSANVTAKLNILELEKSLGIYWTRGLSRQKGGRKIPIIGSLLQEIDRITRDFGGLAQREIRRSAELRQAASATFEALGGEIWPDADQDRSQWLVSDASVEDLGGLYPKDLYFSDPNDREKLHNLFVELIVAKCVRYYENHGRHWHYEVEPHANDTSLMSDLKTLGGRYIESAQDAVDDAAPFTPSQEAGRVPHAHDSSTDEQFEPTEADGRFRAVNSRTSSRPLTNSFQNDVRSPSIMSTRTRSQDADRPIKRIKVVDRSSPAEARKGPASGEQSHRSSLEDTPQEQGDRRSSSISMANEILGDLVNCPSVNKIIQGGHVAGISREHWIMLKAVLTSYPQAREDSALLHAELSRLDKGTASAEHGQYSQMPMAEQAETRRSSAYSQPNAMPAPLRHSRVTVRTSLPAEGRYQRSPSPSRQHTRTSRQYMNPRPSWPALGDALSFPRTNIWLRPKDTVGRSAIVLENQINVSELFKLAQSRMERKLDGRAITSLTFTHVCRSIEDDPIELEPQDQVTWEALLALALSSQLPEPLELRAIVNS